MLFLCYSKNYYKEELFDNLIEVFNKIIKYNTTDISIAAIKCVFGQYYSNVSSIIKFFRKLYFSIIMKIYGKFMRISVYLLQLISI